MQYDKTWWQGLSESARSGIRKFVVVAARKEREAVFALDSIAAIAAEEGAAKTHAAIAALKREYQMSPPPDYTSARNLVALRQAEKPWRRQRDAAGHFLYADDGTALWEQTP